MTNAELYVVLVDENDNELGRCEKIEAHRMGVRHRAFSVIIKDPDGNLLMQRRASGKYHSASLWANACCGHPTSGEEVRAAARKRLFEELGVDCELDWKRSHSYCVEVAGDMTENEFVHVFFGTYSGTVAPNADEVSEVKWIPSAELIEDVTANPSRYAVWLHDYVAHFGGEILAWRS